MKYLSLLTIAALAASCAPSSPPGSDYMAGIGPVKRQASGGPHHSPPAIPDDISYWDGDQVHGSPMIRIVRREQKAYFYKGGTLVGVSRISSGKEDHGGTPPGNYKITQKSKDHKSSIYGVIKDRATGETVNDSADNRKDFPGPGQVFYPAPMPNFLRFNGSIGMHTGYLPGYAASAGCVRLPHHMAEKFFANVEIGTPVIVE